MPLQKQTAVIPFNQGLNLKSDPYQLALGQLLVAENVVFTTPGEVRKRNGFQKLFNLPNGQALTSYLDELIACDTKALYSYNASLGNLVNKGPLTSVYVTQQPVLRNVYQQTAQDGVQAPNGLFLSAWEDTSGGIRYTILDTATGQTVVPNTLLAANGARPKTLVFANRFFIVYTDFTNPSVPVIYFASGPVASPAATLTLTQVTGGSGGGVNQLYPTTPSWDATVCGTEGGAPQLYVVFANAIPGTSIYSYLPTNPLSVSSATSSNTTPTVLTVFDNPATIGPVVAYYNGTRVGWQTWSAFVVSPIPGASITGSATVPGTLAAGAYKYEVTSVNSNGESLPGPSFTVTTTQSQGIKLAWTAVPGAVAYNVYGRVSGLLGMLASGVYGTSFTDNGSVSPGAAPPSSDSTVGQALINSGTVETIANVISLTGAGTSATSNSLQILYSVWENTTPTWKARTRICGVNENTAGTPSDLRRSVALAGKAFLNDGTVYVSTVYQSQLQPTYFIVDQYGNIPDRHLYTQAGGIPVPNASITNYGSALLPEITPVGDTEYVSSYLVADNISSNATEGIFTGTGVTSFGFDFFDPTNSYSRAVLGSTLNVGGGVVSQYDGATVCEAGFWLFPEGTTAVAAGSGGSLSGGQYQYQILYVATDNRGQISYSAPSVPVTISTVNDDAVTLTIPTLRMTNRENVVIQVYRTQVAAIDATTFYLCTTVQLPAASGATNAPILNDPTVDTVTMVDQMSDTALAARPLIYTDGGVLENTAPASLIGLTIWQNRMWGIDSANPLVLWFSKQVVPGLPIEWSDQLTYNVDPRGGPCTALAPMDDKLVVYKETETFIIWGQGPDALGNGEYPDAVLATTDVGCTESRSVAVVPQGHVLGTEKGIWQVDRSLTATYQGAPVEGIVNGNTITSSTLIPNANQIRYTMAPGGTPNGGMVVYDYFANAWSTFTTPPALDSTVWQSEHCFLDNLGNVWQETPGVFNDGGRPIGLTVQTGPLSLAGLQGWQRTWEFSVLGKNASPTRLQISQAYEYNPANSQTDFVTPTPPSSWGSDATWGSGATWGGAWVPLQWRVYVSQGLSEALQITITDAPSGSPPGEGCSLSAITVTYGSKGRTKALPPAQTAGGQGVGP